MRLEIGFVLLEFFVKSSSIVSCMMHCLYSRNLVGLSLSLEFYSMMQNNLLFEQVVFRVMFLLFLKIVWDCG
jgi:hypothetical protein